MNELGLSWDTANMPSLIELKAAKLWHKAPVHTKRFYESALSRGAPCAACAVRSNEKSIFNCRLARSQVCILHTGSHTPVRCASSSHRSCERQ